MNDQATLASNCAVTVPPSEARRLRREARIAKAIAIAKTARRTPEMGEPRLTAAEGEAEYLAREDEDLDHRVYFIYCAGRIKIGYTSKWVPRLESLANGTPNVSQVVFAMPGGKLTEYKLHKRFAAHRLHGEWFALHEDLRNFMVEYGDETSARFLQTAEQDHRAWVGTEAKRLCLLP